MNQSDQKVVQYGTVHSRVESLRGDEPWAGYDELTASEVQSVVERELTSA